MKTDDPATLDIPTETYWIAKYPITNAQFVKFIEAGGYDERRWWTDAGWATQQKGRRVERPLAGKEWNGAEQPVVAVSWYEAVAFCLWLNEMTVGTAFSPSGTPQIMLPTEAQWQYAAQGNDGRNYPWGNDWDDTRCNNSANPCYNNATTPVIEYAGKEKGDSPFGVVDMAGNVWEWCLTDYDKGINDCSRDANNYILKGGSFYMSEHNLRAANRSWNMPGYGDLSYGFRVARSLK